MPVSALLGGPVAGDVPEILSLSAGPVEEIVASIIANGGQAPVVQIKLGVDDLETDMACVSSISIDSDNGCNAIFLYQPMTASGR